MDPFGPAFQEWNEHFGHILVIELGLDPHEEYPKFENLYTIDQLEIWLRELDSIPPNSYLAEIRNISENSSLSLFDVMRTEDCKDLPSFDKYQLSLSWLGYHRFVLRKKGAFLNPGHTVFPLCDLKMHA